MAQTVKTQVQFLGQEDPLEEGNRKGMATHSIILASRKPWPEEPSGNYSPCGHKELDTTESHTHTHTHPHRNSACVLIKGMVPLKP